MKISYNDILDSNLYGKKRKTILFGFKWIPSNSKHGTCTSLFQVEILSNFFFFLRYFFSNFDIKSGASSPGEEGTALNIDTFDAEFYFTAPFDPVAKEMKTVLDSSPEHFNWKLFITEYIDQDLKISDKNCFVWFCDKYGFNLFAQEVPSGEWADYRFPFPREMRDAEDVSRSLSDSIHLLARKYGEVSWFQ